MDVFEDVRGVKGIVNYGIGCFCFYVHWTNKRFRVTLFLLHCSLHHRHSSKLLQLQSIHVLVQYLPKVIKLLLFFL